MRDDNAVAGPSLFLVGTEKAHREHLHLHNLFHKNKRQTETEVDVQQIVTEVVQTVSYVQQIDVDSNGSTFSIQTVLANPTTAAATTDDASSSAPTTTDPASPGVTNTASSASSTAVGVAQPDSSAISQSLLSNSSTTSTSPSVSSIPTSSFALLTVSSNSTTLIPSSSSQIRVFSNSTITSSSSSSSFVYLTSSSSTSYEASSSYDSASSSSFSYLSSDSIATPTVGGGNGGTAVATSAATGITSTSTAAAGNGTGSDSSSTVSTGSVVGGVVGGVAGAAILIFFLMAFLRWKKQHQNMFLLGSGEPGSGGATTRGIEPPPPTQPSGGMSGPRSSLFAVPAALASLTGFKRSSVQSASTDVTGERGFYRVSGRKLPSVLQSGGDGYGDGIVDNTLSGTSFYRDSQGFYGGPSSPTLAAPVGTQRPESGIPVMRPSPARTPVTEHGPFAFGPAPLTPPHRPDVVGRSHPSQDGSHTSRFTEEV